MANPIPETGPEGRDFETQKISLDVSGGRENDKIQVYGNVIKVWDASTAGVLCELNVRDAKFDDPIPWGLGASYHGVEFDEIYLTHEQKAEWIIIQTTYIPDLDYHSVEPARALRTFERRKPAGFDTPDDVTLLANDTTEIVPLNEDRQFLRIQSRDSTNSVYLVSDSATSKIKGYELEPEATSPPIRTTAPIYAYNPNGSNVNVGVIEESDS